MWNPKIPNKRELKNYKKIANLCAILLGKKLKEIK